MAKLSWNDYSATPASNTDIDSVNINEGCAPSGINNAIRELMAHTADVVAGTTALSSINIDGGTIDGTVIGQSSAAAATFTTFTSTGIDDNASSTALTINSSQNVGIGTSVPSTKTEISTNNETSVLRLTDTATIGAVNRKVGGLEFYQNDASGGAGVGSSIAAHHVNVSGDTDLRFATGDNTERMKLDSSGRLGVNTSAPATRLHVLDGTSSLRFRQNGTVAETLTIGPSGSDAAVYLGDATDTVRAGLYYDTSENDLQIRGYNNSTRILINSVGNVGIGTTSPSTQIGFPIGNNTKISQVVGTAHLAGNAGSLALTIADGGGHSGVFINNTHNGTYSSQDITFLTAKGGISAATERMRIDSSGNVGINTTTTLGAKLFVSQGAAASPATSGNMTTGAVIGSSTAGQALNVGTDADGVWYNAAYANNAGVARIHRWLTGGAERMRISGGTLLVGMIAESDTLANTGIELYNDGRLNATRSGNPVLYLNRKTSSGDIVTFRLDGSEEGTISIDSSSGVSYNTTSDYRLKENVTEVTGAANRVKALNPVRFNFIAAPDKIVDGFLAHEVSDIVPEAIHGEKDAVDAEGNPKYQGIDQSKLVPLLTAALQEALTKIDELEVRVAALETA